MVNIKLIYIVQSSKNVKSKKNENKIVKKKKSKNSKNKPYYN